MAIPSRLRGHSVVLAGLLFCSASGCGNKENSGSSAFPESATTHPTDQGAEGPREPAATPGNLAADPDKDVGEEPEKDLGKPDFSLTAKDFYQEFKADKESAAAKYAGKVVELKGLMDDVGRNATGSYVTLEVPVGTLNYVQCFTSSKRPWNKATPGQTVTVRGIYPPMRSLAFLFDCQIVAATGGGASRFSAAELVREFETDPEAEKFDIRRFVVVRGEVVRLDKRELGRTEVQLKASARTHVVCTFAHWEGSDLKDVKPGQEMEALGRYVSHEKDENFVGVNACCLIRAADAGKKLRKVGDHAK
jgi:tRNA_anti-like